MSATPILPPPCQTAARLVRALATIAVPRLLELPPNAVRLDLTNRFTEDGRCVYLREDTGEHVTWREAPVGAVAYRDGRVMLVRELTGSTVVWDDQRADNDNVGVG